MSSFLSALGRRKPVEKSLSQSSGPKTLRWFDLTAYGIAATVGSGIYVTCGKVARNNAGPAVTVSTLIAGLLSLFTGICYLEFASSLPISGSGYAYFYTVLGEFLGWFIGWNLTLEYAFSAAAIAGGWVEYLVTLMTGFGVKIPQTLYSIRPFGALDADGKGSMVRVNFLAGVIVLLVGLVVSRGLKFGSRVTNVITILNIGIILFIIVVGAFYVQPDNWSPFVAHDVKGVVTGAGEMFFSFIGYDTVSTLAADAISPSRDVPIAVILTLVVATSLYMGVGLVLTGMQHFLMLDEASPLAMAFQAVGARWASYFVGVCALTMMAATMMACLIGQPKIFQAIAKDGLLPRGFARENSSGTPMISVLFTTILTAALATTLDVSRGLIDMISFGTLFGMSSLCAGLLVVRFKQNQVVGRLGITATLVYFAGAIASTVCYNSISCIWPAVMCAAITVVLPFLALCAFFILYSDELASTSLGFACPAMPLLPCLAIAANTYVMLQLPLSAISQFLVWTAIGFIIYFGYGIHSSHLGHNHEHEKLYGKS